MSNKFKKAIEYFSKLQGIGPRQASRIVFALLNWPASEIKAFAQTVDELESGITFCEECFNLSEQTRCQICMSAQREREKICVVEKIVDLQTIEKTGLYRGLYHVLGGAINPVEGVLPANLRINELVNRVKALQTSGNGLAPEVILATNPNTYGETTALYLTEILTPLNTKITRLARGLSSGSFLEYTDATTLQNAFKNRR